MEFDESGGKINFKFGVFVVIFVFARVIIAAYGEEITRGQIRKWIL